MNQQLCSLALGHDQVSFGLVQPELGCSMYVWSMLMVYKADVASENAELLFVELFHSLFSFDAELNVIQSVIIYFYIYYNFLYLL